MIFSSGAPSAKLASVPHVRQMASWDCGLACISMILLALGMEHSLLGLGEDVASESVWTIDMAYLLQKFGVKDFTYYTSYIGVNWQYVTKDFYRDTLEQDRRRVHSLFAAARENQVRVICLTLALDDIRRFLLSTVYAVVVLVDLRMVRCKTCRRGSWGKWRWPWRRVVSMGETAGAEFHDQPPVSVTTTNSIYGSTRRTPTSKSKNKPYEGRSGAIVTRPNIPTHHLSPSHSTDPSFPVSSPPSHTPDTPAAARHSSDSLPRSITSVSSTDTRTTTYIPSTKRRSCLSMLLNPFHCFPCCRPSEYTPLKPSVASQPLLSTSQQQQRRSSTSQVYSSTTPYRPATSGSGGGLGPRSRTASSYEPKPYYTQTSTPPRPTPSAPQSPRTAPTTPTRNGLASTYPSPSVAPPSPPTAGGMSLHSGGSDPQDDFIGHYIVLIGYDVDEDRFYYRDPGTEAELCCMDADDFERARGGCGTDYDVIVSRVR